MNFDFPTALGFGASGLLGGFAFPLAEVAPPTIPGLESFGASGAIVGVLIYLILQSNRERVAEATKFAERIKEIMGEHTATVQNYQATTADLIERVLSHYERQMPENSDEE